MMPVTPLSKTRRVIALKSFAQEKNLATIASVAHSFLLANQLLSPEVGRELRGGPARSRATSHGTYAQSGSDNPDGATRSAMDGMAVET